MPYRLPEASTVRCPSMVSQPPDFVKLWRRVKFPALSILKIVPLLKEPQLEVVPNSSPELSNTRPCFGLQPSEAVKL